MAAADTDVIDANLRLVATAKLELGLLWCHRQQMHITGVVLVKRHGLEQNVVVVVVVNVLGDVHNLVDVLLDLERVWVHLLADFALEALPVEASHIALSAVLRSFLLLLRLQPVLQALEVDEADRALALACNNQWVVLRLLGRPADAALNLLGFDLTSVTAILRRPNFLGFSEFLLIKLFGRHLQ